MGNLHEDPSGLLPGGSARHNDASSGLQWNGPVDNLGRDPSGLPLDGPTSAQAGAVSYNVPTTKQIQQTTMVPNIADVVASSGPSHHSPVGSPPMWGPSGSLQSGRPSATVETHQHPPF